MRCARLMVEEVGDHGDAGEDVGDSSTTIDAKGAAGRPRGLASRYPAAIKLRRGRLAQLVERLLYTQDVGGSSSSPPTGLRAFGASAGKPPRREGRPS